MKVLVIDDHPLILSALQGVVEGLAAHVSTVGVATARGARAALAADPSFDLILLDLRLGDADGFAVLSELRAAHPSIPVVVVSASDHHADVVRAIDLGAMGYVPKRESNDTLAQALHVVMTGGVYVPQTGVWGPAVVGRAGGAPGRALDPSSIAAFRLTPRQTDVLALLLRGYSNKLIARELGLSVETVKDHVAAVLRGLGVSSRTQAVIAVSRMPEQGRAVSLPDRPSA